MPSGGARARSGPPPDPNALRRDRSGDAAWLTLPAHGREGAPPRWPLTKPTTRERALWKRLWARPQAILWEQDGQLDHVALYVRAFEEAQEPGAAPAKRTLVARLAGELLLTIPAMLSARVQIAKWDAPDAEAAPKAPAEGKRRSQGSARTRLTVVDAPAAD